MTEELLRLVKVRGVGEGGRLGHKARDQVEAVVEVRRGQIDHRMLGIVALIPVVAQGGEHRAVIHIVAVDAGVLIGKVGGVAAVDEDRAVGVDRIGRDVVDVVEVVVRVGDRVVDLGIRAVDVRHIVGAGVAQRLKINRDRRDLGIDVGLLLLQRHGRGGGDNRHDRLGNLRVGLLRLFIALERGDNAVGAVREHADQYHTENDQYLLQILVEKFLHVSSRLPFRKAAAIIHHSAQKEKPLS